jgi:hypothetical protein
MVRTFVTKVQNYVIFSLTIPNTGSLVSFCSNAWIGDVLY